MDSIMLLCATSIGLDKGGLPGTAALGTALALALTETEAAGRLVASLVPILFTADIGAVIAYRKYVEWRIIKTLLFPCLIGVLLGYSVLDLLPKVMLRKLVGLVLLVVTVLNFYVSSHEQSKVLPITSPTIGEEEEKDKFSSLLKEKVKSIMIGVCIGFFTMVANLAGPLLVVYLLKSNLSKEHINGTRAWIFLILNVAKIPLQLYLGNLQFQNAAFLLPYVLLGTGCTLLTEALIVQHLNQEVYKTVSWILVLFGSLNLIAL